MQRATDVMKRGDNPGQSTNAQQAAQDLRQASNLLAGTQHQLASNKVDSLTREADRLRQEQSAQTSQINKFAGQQSPQGITDLDAMLARRRQLTQLAQDRQQLSDSLSNLQRNVRDTAREMASNQPDVAQNLRDALKEMDNSDLDNRVQRTADWLRRGINPNANGTEDEIAQGLAKLSQQLQQAQKGMGQTRPGQRRGTEQDQAALIDQVEQLRNQIESMTRSNGNRGNGQNQGGQSGQNRQQRFSQDTQLSRNGQQARQPGGQNGQNGQSQDRRQPGSGQPGSDQSGQNQQAQSGANGPATGDVGNRSSSSSNGEVVNGRGRGADGTAWNNINTGNNRYTDPRRTAAANSDSLNSAADYNYQEGMRALNQLRQMVKDPQAAKDIAELTRQMQHLDPSRFPGNPAMVEQMHQEILNSVNRLEIQLQRDGIAPEARSGNPNAVPAGYQDSVADYYRRLSKNP